MKQYRFDYIKEMVDKWNPGIPKDFDTINATPFGVFIGTGLPFKDYYGELILDVNEWLRQRKEYIEELVRKYSSIENCKNCEAHIIPYKFSIDKKGRKLPYNECIHTCKCNITPNDRPSDSHGSYGFCGYCHPELCKGANNPYIVTYHPDLGFGLKFIERDEEAAEERSRLKPGFFKKLISPFKK